MRGHVTVGSSNVVEFYKKNQFRLAQEYEDIAENEEIGVVIYLSDTNGRPTVSVFADDIPRAEVTTNLSELENLVKTVYDTYLDEQNFIAATADEEVEEIEEEYSEEELEQSLIDDRESEIDAALIDFLTVVMQTEGYGFDGAIDEIFDDVKEHYLEYLARKHKIELYRPMYLEDENGEEFFEEYPYECMEFEDEDNPIYM